jgi:hypothetical protein
VLGLHLQNFLSQNLSKDSASTLNLYCDQVGQFLSGPDGKNSIINIQELTSIKSQTQDLIKYFKQHLQAKDMLASRAKNSIANSSLSRNIAKKKSKRVFKSREIPIVKSRNFSKLSDYHTKTASFVGPN